MSDVDRVAVQMTDEQDKWFRTEVREHHARMEAFAREQVDKVAKVLELLNATARPPLDDLSIFAAHWVSAGHHQHLPDVEAAGQAFAFAKAMLSERAALQAAASEAVRDE